MLLVGMDVHKDHTVFDLFDPSLEKKRQHRTVTVPTTREHLESVLAPLKGRCRVAFEVGTQAQWVASVIRPLAAEVQVANPSRIDWLFKDGRKNDQIDARKLSTLLHMNELPLVHLPRVEVSWWRSLINSRRTQVRRRTMVKNQLRSILRAAALRCPHKGLWTRRGLEWLRSLQFDEIRQGMIRRLMRELAFLQAAIAEEEADLDRLAEKQPAVARLRTIPGIGPRCAEAIVAFADDVRRFGRGRQFASYFGMTPKQDASGGVDRHGHISKRGPSVVRWVLIEAAHQVTRRCRPIRAFCDRIWQAKRGRYKQAIVATGRKLLTIMFAMLRDGTDFDPERLIRPDRLIQPAATPPIG
jgi:transposase